MLAMFALALTSVLSLRIDLETPTVAADESIRGAVSFEVSEPIAGRDALGYIEIEGAELAPAPAELAPGTRYRVGFRIGPDAELLRIAASIGRPLVFFEPGTVQVGVPRTKRSLAQAERQLVTITPAAPDAVTIGALAMLACEGALPPDTDPALARRLFEVGVSLGWKPPAERFSAAPVLIELEPHSSFPEYDGADCGEALAPFYVRAHVGDEIAIHNPSKRGVCNFHGDDFNVGIPAGDVYMLKLRTPGRVRVRCDVHRGATLGWMLVEE